MVGDRLDRQGGAAAVAGAGGGAQRARQVRSGLGLRGDGAGDCGRGEARVRQTEAERVDVADEACVDDRDPLAFGDGAQQRLGVRRVGGDPDVKPQGPQIAFERRPGDRLTGQDGGRQTNSLLDCRRGSRRARA
ncbi:hypothetical protein M4V62_07670 [Streptomyces durmitorensis]|uniref:Uncharacterized protein n=1 Tax=Streptomyces durmitorensis TaxID=319947 RepID=A0ABY4PNJ5_9ACTN|nr:hypothetical protein [Streptomyces durmitorensis]UQT54982.1 hypothetical protein M4V62_07670 [Streptomyces durmitorensis]